MSSSRVTAQQRVEAQSVAEREIQRYAHDHYLWHKHIHNVALDAIQILKCEEMDMYKNTIDYSTRRLGKTFVSEMYLLKFLACNSDQELGIVAPREKQAMTALKYHQDAIKRSEILSAYIDVDRGRRQIADSYHRFVNRSAATAYGIMSQIDGGDLTIARLDEIDDMPHSRLFNNFLPMLGATRRAGAAKDAINDPQIRVTGVMKGGSTLTSLITDEGYRVIGAFHGEAAQAELQCMINKGWLAPSQVGNIASYPYPIPIGNAIRGIELGLLQKEFIEFQRTQVADDEFARQYLCVSTQSKNLIWQEWIQRAVGLGLRAKLEPVIPMPGHVYKKRGLISLGYDHTGHGERPESSRSAVVITEDLAGFTVPIFAKTWPPGTDESIIRRAIVAIWQYFRPDGAMGDAFGIGLIGNINDDLYRLGLIQIDRLTLGDSTSSNWGEWAFSPIRFDGMVKHSMAVSLASAFSAGRMALPYVYDIEPNDETYGDVEDLQRLYSQLSNIEAVATSKTYASYKMLKRDVGDDLFDAFMAANWAMLSGAGDVPTTILLGTTSRQKMLGAS